MAVTEGIAVILELLAGPPGAVGSAGLDVVSAGDGAGETALTAGNLALVPSTALSLLSSAVSSAPVALLVVLLVLH